MKKYKFLLIFVIAFFVFTIDANAITFSWTSRIYYNSNLGFSSTKGNGYTKSSLIKKYNGGKTNAFCSDRSKDFYSEKSYTKDKTYKSATCKYKIYQNGKWVAKTGGDCSKIVGYIIQKAYAKAGKSEFKKYGYAQSSIWVYLGLFSPNDYAENNKNVKSAWNNNSAIKSIIQNAWTQYYNDMQSGNTTTETSTTNLYTLSGYDNKFYYVPESNECGSSGGKYRTKNITITANEKIKLKLDRQSNGFKIVVLDSNGNSNYIDGDYEIELQQGDSKIFYLETTESSYIGTANLSIRADKVNANTTSEEITIYDSERYKRGGPTGQGVIIQKSSTIKRTELNKVYQEQDLTFNQDRLDFKTPSGESNTNASKKCANLTTNYNETQAELKKSICKTLDLGSGSFVRIILTETVQFNYGYLYPSKYTDPNTQTPIVYAGGSFRLNVDETMGAVTNYKVGIGWQFADYNLTTGKPYYYNKANLAESDATGKIDVINNLLISEIKNNYKNLTLNIDTFDSNELGSNGKGITPTYEYNINIYNNSGTKTNIDNIAFSNDKKLQLTINKIELKQYQMKENKNGVVEYVDENGHHNAYFTPMYYPDDTFKFNIIESNLSLIDEIDLYYQAECYIGVEDRFNQDSLRYRSISVNNPFPKGNTTTGEGIPTNWKNWYLESLNQNRIKDTYDNGIIYSINLNNAKSEKIKQINDESTYIDWNNIDQKIDSETNGSSKLVTDLFDVKANNKSYCKIGEFDPINCDK